MRFADILARRVLEQSRAHPIQTDVDCWFVGAVVKTRLRIVDPISGQYHPLLHKQHLAVFILEHVVAERHSCTRSGLMFFIHHAHFQCGGTPQNFLGTRSILHAGQLHHHAVYAFLLDHRFGHTQFIHPVAQGEQVLLHGGCLYALRCFRLERNEQMEFLAYILVIQGVVCITLLDFGFALAARIGVAELHHQRIAFPVHAGIRDILFAQRTAYIFGGRIQRFGQCGLHVHLQQKMHTAAQVQAQIHRQRMQIGQPPR